jgi:hypothetical protein
MTAAGFDNNGISTSERAPPPSPFQPQKVDHVENEKCTISRSARLTAPSAFIPCKCAQPRPAATGLPARQPVTKGFKAGRLENCALCPVSDPNIQASANPSFKNFAKPQSLTESHRSYSFTAGLLESTRHSM